MSSIWYGSGPIWLEGHHGQRVQRQLGQQVMHGHVANNGHALDTFPDALGQVQGINGLIDGSQGQPV